MTNVLPKLYDGYRMTKTAGISIIGCPDTGAVIGLDSEGESLIKELENGNALNFDTLTNNQLMLMNALFSFCMFWKSVLYLR